MTTLPEYEIHAIRYATRDGMRREHFIGGDPHELPMPMDYYIWVITGPAGSIVMDLGFTAEMAKARKRTFLRCPIESLRLVGVDARDVDDVIVSHMHYDHAGNLGAFPKARFHLQAREMAYATGKYMRYARPGHSYHVDDVCDMVRLNFKGRVEMHEGMVEIAPGITLHPAPGHADGLQVARVHTKRGWVVLASDATHYYEHVMRDRLFMTAFHLGEMLDSYKVLRKLAPTERHIIPGHDPHVMREYEPPRPDLAGAVVRLDVPPTGPAATFPEDGGH